MQIHKDLLHKIMYSTDASAYREFPEGVFYPQNKEDLTEIVKLAIRNKFSLIPRAGGTSLAGQVVGSGVVVDVSRHLNRIIEINPAEGWAKVEPGVVLEHLNSAAAEFGLFFGPETSTADRCCMAGMGGNNSCGSHSLVYGSTREHLLEAEVVLSDGSVAVFKPVTKRQIDINCSLPGREGDIYRLAASILDNKRVRAEIEEHFPDKSVKRRNTGYAIDSFIEPLYLNQSHSELSRHNQVDTQAQTQIQAAEPLFNLCNLLAGSEGTLAMITELKLALVPMPPKERALLCAHFSALEDALKANLVALAHKPFAVELMDSNILELSKQNLSQSKNRFFIEGDPAAILIIEFADDTLDGLELQVENAQKDLLSQGLSYYCSTVYGKECARVWALRKAGLGLLTSVKGDAKPVSVIEDTAVAPERLPGYINDIKQLLAKYNLHCVFHAHIGTGELHLRPVLNLKDERDVQIFSSLAEETALLVKKHRGSLSGEHGDGRLRGQFIPMMTGDYLYGIIKEIKNTFDPDSLFNPNKITDTPPMNSSLRYQAGKEVREYKTMFDYSAQGGWLRAIEQCNGSGDCRRSVQTAGTMCPSFRLTGREEDSTRGRSNVMRELLTNPLSKRVFDQKEILSSLDLCLSCKACKSECPSNVDMTRYKAEFLNHYYGIKGIKFRPFMISIMAQIQKFGSLIPDVYNFFAANSFTSSIIKSVLRFSSERSLPTLSRITLRRYASMLQKRKSSNDASLMHKEDSSVNTSMMHNEDDSVYASILQKRKSQKQVYLFADEFTNYNEAEVGIAFIELLNSLGYNVIIPRHYESGRAAMSKGMLKRAAYLANRNVKALKDIITQETPLTGIEPSTILSFRDEYPDLVSDDLKASAKLLASNALLYDEFIMREVDAGRIRPDSFTSDKLKIFLHGHCHQKALASVELSAKMLSLPRNYTVETIPSGCCGMAGAFGYEKEHYQVSMAIGEQVLFPAVRSADESVVISAPGTSCRQQILDGTGRLAKHPVEILREALKTH